MKSGSKVFALLLASIFIASSLSGCTTSPATEAVVVLPTDEPAQVIAPTETIAPAVAATDPPATRTVTDMTGRTVTLPAEIKSVATFGAIGVLNTFVETMGQGSKICNEGSASFTKSASWEKYQYVFAPQLKTSPVFQDANGEIIMETVLATKSDVSLTMTKELTDQLEAQGLNVIQLSWKDQNDIKPAITLLGEVFNAQDVAADYLAYFDEKVALAEDLTENIKAEDKKTVLYGSISSFTQPHLIAEWWIPAAGGISVTKDAPREKESLVYTLEDLLKWNPDTMIVSSSSEKEKVLADTRLADVKAVKNGQIFIIPRVAHVWGNRTTEQPLTIFWTLNKLYPEIMTDEALSKEIFYFYSHFFKVDLTDEQIKEIVNFNL